MFYWVLFVCIPLFFVFVYSRSLARNQSSQSSLQLTAAVHLFLALIATFMFGNYARRIHNLDLPDAIVWALLAFFVVVWTTFFVSALFLVFRRKSSLATFASFLLWPYWLLIALLFTNRYFAADFLPATVRFICFLTPIFLAFAAGGLTCHPKIAHAAALAGLAAFPWIYTDIWRGNIYWNEWIAFNVPDEELFRYNVLAPAIASILAVALLILAVAIAGLRLLPNRVAIRGVPFSHRTWPAFLVCFFFLAVWFSQSVMPYRLPGAVDYSSWPLLQILHVQKHGLQFQETCVKVRGHRGTPESIYVSWNERRLFEYRFRQRTANVDMPKPLADRIMALIQSSKALKSDRKPIKPLRRWNDEAWYLTGEDLGLQAYTRENQSAIPQEVLGLFDDIATLPRTQETSIDRKDVCLGFCYDGLSALGALYANHRCNNELSSNGYVCR